MLRKAVEHYGRQGGNRLQGLIATLNDFPEDVIDWPTPRRSPGSWRSR